MAKNVIKKKIRFLLAILFLLVPLFSFAMSSGNFRIDADSVNSGGSLSNSLNFKLGDSVGEAAIGVESSTNYKSKTALWYMFPETKQISLSCESADVYMIDYTLGDITNYSKYIFSTSQECFVTDNTDVDWSLTMYSTDMTSARNTLSNLDVNLATNADATSADTITEAISGSMTGIAEPTTGDNHLNTPVAIITGTSAAAGAYSVRPTVKLTNLNSLYNEQIQGVITITIN